MTDNPKELATLLFLAIQAGWDPRFFPKAPMGREGCSQCGKKIPPSRAGRRCEECRKGK